MRLSKKTNNQESQKKDKRKGKKNFHKNANCNHK